MRFVKQHLCALPHCYAVGVVTVDGREKYIFATDNQGPCYAIDAETYERETVWDGPGGTMSIVPLPGTNGEFLASQNFMPNFSALHARIVRCAYIDGRWRVEPWMELPYVHRFDLLWRGGACYLLACILSGTANEQADWDAPGWLSVARLDEGFAPPASLETIAGGMTRNHGYFRLPGEPGAAYTAADQGVFLVEAPETPGGDWRVERILETRASDIALCDIDGDGALELAVIAPFHGDRFSVYRKTASGYDEIYRYPTPMDFLHVVWGGRLNGEPCFLGGCRALDKELFALRWSGGALECARIETGFGPSNAMVLDFGGHSRILVANRESAEGALFDVFD